MAFFGFASEKCESASRNLKLACHEYTAWVRAELNPFTILQHEEGVSDSVNPQLIEAALDKVRQQNLARVAGLALKFNYICLFVFFGRALVFSDLRSLAQSDVLQTLVSSAILYFTCTKRCLSSARNVTLLMLAMNALPIMDIISADTSEQILTSMASRVSVRFLVGIIFLNKEITMACNVAQSAVTLALLQADRADIRSDASFQQVCKSEIVLLVTMTVCMVTLESWMKERIAASLRMQECDRTHQAARRLLSVTCDCDLMLSSALDIIRPSPKLTHLLMMNRKIEAGEPFAKFIFESDLERFQNFIDSSSQQSELDDASLQGHMPPTSLHLSFRDAAGLKVPVELFHVPVPGPLGSGLQNHMLGIKESSEASSRSEISEVRSVSSTDGIISEFAAGRRSAIAHPSSSSSLSSSSRHSASSGFSKVGVPALDSITVVVDASEPNLNIHKASLVWQTGHGKEGKVSTLKDWVQGRSWRDFAEWVQNQTNACIYQDEVGSAFHSFHSLKLLLVGSDVGILKAQNVIFSGLLPDGFDGSGQDDNDDEGGDLGMLVQIEMRDFSARRAHHDLLGQQRGQQRSSRRAPDLGVIRERRARE